MERFCPSSSQPYYLINMHDLLNLYKGLLLLSPNTKPQVQPQFSRLNYRWLQNSSHSTSLSYSQKKSYLKPKRGRKGIQLPRRKPVTDSHECDHQKMIDTLRMVIRVWCHESTRVYLDRTTESRDRLWFLKLLKSCIKYCFCGFRLTTNLPPKDSFASGQAVGHTEGRHNRSIL